MKRCLFTVLVVVVAMFALLTACTPQTQPTPAAAPTSAPTKAVSTVAPAATASPEQAAWDKIVAAGKQEGKVTIYSYNLTGDIGLAVSKAFKDRYGIDLDIVTGRGAAFIERLKTEKRMGSLLADSVDQNPVNAKMMKDLGFSVGIADELPTLRDKNVWVADIYTRDPKDKHIITFNFNTYAPFVNTNLVKPGEEPKVWKDFLDPKWKSKIVTLDPTTSAGLFEFLIPLLREKVIDEDFVKALYKQDMRFSTGYPDEAPLVARGERAISLNSTSVNYAQFVAQGAPLKAVTLEDGTILGVVVQEALNGPHPNAVKVYINWIMSAEGQDVWGKAASVSSVRKDVANYMPLAAQINPKRLIVQTNEDSDQATKWFQDRYLNKLWGRTGN